MHRVLITLSPVLLGLSGSILELITIGGIMAAAISNLAACSCGFAYSVDLVQWPIVGGSLLALVGCLAYAKNVYAGGTFLLAGGLIALPPVLYLEVYGFPFLGFLLGPSTIFASLIVLGGLLALPRTRHVIKALHNGGWIP